MAVGWTEFINGVNCCILVVLYQTQSLLIQASIVELNKNLIIVIVVVVVEDGIGHIITVVNGLFNKVLVHLVS